MEREDEEKEESKFSKFQKKLYEMVSCRIRG